MKRMRTQMTTLLLAAIIAAASAPLGWAADRQKLDRSAAEALENLTASDTAAKLLAGRAKAVLVFPNIVKAGLLFGGQMGDGVLMENGRPVGYYNSIAASYGLQAGVQVFGYALFFMNDAALAYLGQSDGWEIGAGPSVVVVDQGRSKSLTSTTLTHDVYALIFNQKGLMGGLGIQGSKITKLSN
jgi:lipid-binding SYLF domain-containing protein